MLLPRGVCEYNNSLMQMKAVLGRGKSDQNNKTRKRVKDLAGDRVERTGQPDTAEKVKHSPLDSISIPPFIHVSSCLE